MFTNTFGVDIIKRKGGIYMCDEKKYRELFQEIQKLTPEDTLELVMEAEIKEEQDFFELIGDFLLQIQQKKVVGAHFS